ncbi:hypothetical protein [Cesiribacter andamanensis]|uniref:Tetratricopeptide repeat protein n=1 Tax=Cesiribacter andamanensis AMV16 TaxID=1279009 RepID=M7NB58_9BACT|nr:hypothetical protein [Cesiribacter andamanensis]EMR04512.1 hypothetical protein ADICEAN_00270 [Cesiribacter andamanensis AMV16]
MKLPGPLHIPPYPLLLAALSLLLLLPVALPAQTAGGGARAAFQSAANLYIAGQQQEALQSVERALRQYPTDPKLLALAEKLKQDQQEQQKQEQQQQNQNQQSQQQEQGKEGEPQPQEQNQQGQQQPNDQQRQEAEQEQMRESEQGTEQKVQPLDARGETERRLQEMNISPEKARMLLEAMRSNEIQYLQQKQRQPARRQKSNKPDW